MCLAIPRSEKVLVITAHPDDVDFGAAGTVATWTDAGIEVSYCIVTDGDAGGYDETVGRARDGVAAGAVSRSRRPSTWESTTCGSSVTPMAASRPRSGFAKILPG